MHFVSKRKKPEAVMLRAGDELGREKGVIALDVGGCCVAAFFLLSADSHLKPNTCKMKK